MKLVDTHTHIYGDKYNSDFFEVLKRTKEELEFIVSIGYDLESSKKSVELSNKYDFIYSTVGIHPVDIKEYNDEVEKELIAMVKNNTKVVAIGEIGLDYYWMEDPKEIQQDVFRKQLNISRETKLPVVIHTRDALEDTLKILSEYKDIGGILHCFPGSYDSVKSLLDRYYVGVAGVVTFKNNKKTQEMVKQIPLDRVVIETDCPYLTPEPFRGHRNEPTYVKYVAEKIAEIKGISYEEVIKVTTENAKAIYNIK